MRKKEIYGACLQGSTEMFHTRRGVAWIPEGSQISQPSSCWNALDETYLIYFPLRLWNQGGKPRKALVQIVTRAKDSSPAKRQAKCSNAPRPGSTSPTSKIQQIFATNLCDVFALFRKRNRKNFATFIPLWAELDQNVVSEVGIEILNGKRV